LFEIQKQYGFTLIHKLNKMLLVMLGHIKLRDAFEIFKKLNIHTARSLVKKKCRILYAVYMEISSSLYSSQSVG
jgi:hypothetical protein